MVPAVMAHNNEHFIMDGKENKPLWERGLQMLPGPTRERFTSQTLQNTRLHLKLRNVKLLFLLSLLIVQLLLLIPLDPTSGNEKD